MRAEIARPSERSAGIKLDFVERVGTPKRVMGLAIRLHRSGLSLSNTTSVLETSSFERARSTVHNWVLKPNFEPMDGRNPEKGALDETVINVVDARYWLYAAVDPETNGILHVRLYPTRTIVTTKMFLRTLNEKHSVDDAEFFVDCVPWLQAGLFELGMHFRDETHWERNPVERVFSGGKTSVPSVTGSRRSSTGQGHPTRGRDVPAPVVSHRRA